MTDTANEPTNGKQPTKTPAITPQAIRNRVAIVGFAAVIVGLVGFDWRIALVVGGIALVIVAVAGTAISSTSIKR